MNSQILSLVSSFITDPAHLRFPCGKTCPTMTSNDCRLKFRAEAQLSIFIVSDASILTSSGVQNTAPPGMQSVWERRNMNLSSGRRIKKKKEQRKLRAPGLEERCFIMVGLMYLQSCSGSWGQVKGIRRKQWQWQLCLMTAFHGPGTVLRALPGMLIQSLQQPYDIGTILVTVLEVTNKEA